MSTANQSTIAHSRATIPRWVIAIAFLAVLAFTGQWIADSSVNRQDLGFRVQPANGQMVVSWVQPAGLGWDRDLRPGDVILTADGTPVTANVDPAVVASAHIVTFRSGATVRTADSSTNSLTTPIEEASLLTIAAIYALVGAAVFIIADDTITSSAVLANAVFSTVVLEQLSPGIEGAPAHIRVLYLATIGSSASLLLLAWVFPINRLKVRRNRILAAISLAPTPVVMSLFMAASLFNSAMYIWLRGVSYLVDTAQILVAVALMLLAVLRPSPEQRPARRAMGIIGLGVVAALLPTVVILIIPHFLGVRNLAPAWTATFGTIFMPISLGVAVTSRQFFGVTRLLRRGLVALIIWLVLIAILSVLVRGFDHWRPGGTQLGAENPFLTALLLAIVTLLLWPVQSWLRRRSEKLLFRDVYDYQATLQNLSIEIVELREAGAIAQRVLSRLVDVLDLSWAKLTLFTESGTTEIEHRASGPNDPGRPADESSAGESRTVTLIIEHDTIGTLALGPKRHDVELNPEDIALVTTLTPMMATALQSALLLRRLEDQVHELVDREQELAALSGKLIRVQEEERSRLALDLHDDPLQRAILLTREISQTSPELDRAQLRSEAEEIISSLRAICAGLRPPVLDDFGLVAGLESLVSEARARSELDVWLEVETPDGVDFGRLEPELETALYRVTQEALNNCVKHASATTVQVLLAREAGGITLRVADDGQGVTTETHFGPDDTHLGLLGMRERLQPWGGSVDVSSERLHGTTVSVIVPMRGIHD